MGKEKQQNLNCWAYTRETCYWQGLCHDGSQNFTWPSISRTDYRQKNLIRKHKAKLTDHYLQTDKLKINLQTSWCPFSDDEGLSFGKSAFPTVLPLTFPSSQSACFFITVQLILLHVLLRLQPTTYLTWTKFALTLRAEINTFLQPARSFLPIRTAR